jgi:hypothetical protein
VNLTGNFPGGAIPLIIKEWYSDAIMAEVPMIEGVLDQPATLVMLDSGGRKATSQVHFKAYQVLRQIPNSLLTIAACSHNASFHNVCEMGTNDTFVGVHQNLPDGMSNTSGTDLYTVKPLKNGWTLYFTLTGSCNISPSTSTLTCPWSTYPETATFITEWGPVEINTSSNIYSNGVGAIGPVGVPMQ